MSSPSSVTISTGARLHFGPLTNGLQRGRLFGGIGMMIDHPALHVRATLDGAGTHAVTEDLAVKVGQILGRYAETFPGSELESVSLRVDAETGLHAGLGTGTQLAISVASAIDRVLGRNHSLAELARAVGRGQRSALGVHGFERGGFLVDGGKRNRDALGTLITRVDVPDVWRIVLITPPNASGLSGSEEEQAFLEIEPMSEELTGKLCRLVLMEILPALNERDFERFSSAVHEYGAHVGDYFAPVQGARYAHPQMCELADWLRAQGFRGLGQTSWGPTLFAFCEQQTRADDLEMRITRESRWSDCNVRIVAPRNRSADISCSH